MTIAYDISAVIITKNEADRIEKCINSLLPLTDDIIVIDSGSTDDTRNIAKKMGALVVETDWKGYGQTKNYGHTKAKYDWIISIDADEVLSSKLLHELMQLELKSSCVYAIDRQNYYMDKCVKHSGWSPDWVLRIFHKSEVKWNNNLVHEKLIIRDQTQIVKLKNKLHHYSYRSVDDHMEKVEKYAALRAQIWLDNDTAPSLIKRWFGPAFKGFKLFVMKLGFLDGRIGWVIAKVNIHLVKRQIYYFDKFKNSKT